MVQKQSVGGRKSRVKKVKLLCEIQGVLVARMPTGGATRVGVKELGATSRRLALH
jgi:hypothetical protein